MGLGNALGWYQKKIGAYDTEFWEKTVEERILKGVNAIPKKIARVKTELIDVDLVRGSAFPKAKPQHSWVAATIAGLIRIIFLPFYYTWWQQQTCSFISSSLLVIYVIQVFSLYLYFTYLELAELEVIPLSEVITPVVLLLFLGIVHSQIVSTVSNKKNFSKICSAKRTTIKKRVKRKFRSRSAVVQLSDNDSPETPTDPRARIPCCCKKLLPLKTNNAQIEKENASHNPLAPTFNKKKCSDEESGLDLTNNSEDCENPVHCTCCRKNTSKLLQTGIFEHMKIGNQVRDKPISKSQNEESDGSSGDELFVLKNNSLSFDENLKQDKAAVKRPCNLCDSKSWRRYSDVYDKTHVENKVESIKRRYSENYLVTYSIKTVSNKNEEISKSCPTSAPAKPMAPRGASVPLSLHLQNKKQAPCYSSCESDIDSTTPNTPTKPILCNMEWPIINNPDCTSDTSDSVSAGTQDGDDEIQDVSISEDPFAWELQEASNLILNTGHPGPNKVSCTIWEQNQYKKVDLNVLDITSAIIHKVDSAVSSSTYMTIGLLFSLIVAILPILYRLQTNASAIMLQDIRPDALLLGMPNAAEIGRMTEIIQRVAFGHSCRTSIIIFFGVVQRFALSATYFFLLCVAERTFKQRFLYAKHFCQLTSARRARRSELPHFRLNKVRNIKTWLSVRSYLKKHGPQRSVDVVVSTAFILTVCLVSFLCVQLLKDCETFTERLYSWDCIFWSLALGVFLMRFMILGSKVNKKYRNLSVLITEQINLYLHMEQKPHKKEELLLANNVLKLAADLLKELESPYKISGLCANPFLYNITKVFVLSAFSAVLTELLGFKLKLLKIKLK